MSLPSSDAQGPIAAVHEGMHVVDASGDDVGKVREVRMGDPGAVTTEGQGTDTGGPGGLLGGLLDAVGGGNDLPEAHRADLVRQGYVRIDASGIFTGDCYAAADEIDRVESDVVHLSVSKDRLRS